MIIHKTGDIFNTNADAIAHGVNTVGRMSAGLAKQIKEKYPDVYRDFKEYCSTGLFLPGEGYMYENKEKPHIINLATQYDKQARYDYVESALSWLEDSYKELGLESVAMPRIATGLGKLEWGVVEKIIEQHFNNSKLEVEVWTLGSD